VDACLGYRLDQPWLVAAALLASMAASLAIVQRRRKFLAGRAAAAVSQDGQGSGQASGSGTPATGTVPT
jgi:hypothetical protein